MLRRIWNLINTKLQQLPWFDIRMCSLFDALWFYYVNDNIYKANECFYRKLNTYLKWAHWIQLYRLIFSIDK